MKDEQFIQISELMAEGDYPAARGILLPLSAKGDPEADFLIATLFFLDDSDSTEREVIDCLGRAIEEEYPPALHLRSTLVVSPAGDLKIGDPQGPKERKLLLRSAELGYAPAQFTLAGYLWDGEGGFQQSGKEARHWFKEACEQGYVGAYVDYALMLLEGEGGKQEVGPAIGWLQKGLIERDPDCAEFLAEIYTEGLYGIEPDEDLAEKFDKLADEFFVENFDPDCLPQEVADFAQTLAHLPEKEKQIALRAFLQEFVEGSEDPPPAKR